MKVLVCSPGYHPDVRGGGEISTRLLCLGLRAAGVEVEVLAAHRQSREDIVDGIPVHRIQSPNLYWSFDSSTKSGVQRVLWHLREAYDWRTSTETEALLRRVQPDILHTSGIEDHSPRLWKLARRHGIRVVHTLRSYTLMCPPATVRTGDRNCTGWCVGCRALSLPKRTLSSEVDAVIGISRYVLERHTALGYFPRATQHVIPNIPEEGSPARISRPREGRLVLGFLGRLSPEKGVEHLLAALAQLAPSDRPQLLIGGWGNREYEDALKSRAAGLDVTFLGKVSPRELFARIDLLAVPSLWHEPLGRIVLEANSHGVPVLAAARGGLPELVLPGRTGWLFDPDDIPGFAALIRARATEPRAVRELAAACQQAAEAWDGQIIAARHLTVYGSLLPPTEAVERVPADATAP